MRLRVEWSTAFESQISDVERTSPHLRRAVEAGATSVLADPAMAERYFAAPHFPEGFRILPMTHLGYGVVYTVDGDVVTLRSLVRIPSSAFDSD